MSAFIYPLFFRFLIKQQIMKYFAILVILCKLAKVWTFVFYQREKEKWSEIYFRQLTTWMFVELKIKTCHYQSFFIIFNWFSQNLVHTIKKRKLGFTGQDSAGRRRPHHPGFRNSLFPSRASWFSPSTSVSEGHENQDLYNGWERRAQSFRTARRSTEPCYRVRLVFWPSFGKVEFIENWIGRISLVLFTSGEMKSFRNKYFQPRKSKRSWNE